MDPGFSDSRTGFPKKEVTALKVARFFALIFAVLGIVLMLGTAFMSFTSLNKPVGILENPDGAQRCADALEQCLNEGDLTAAAKLLYGQPSFGVEELPEAGYTALLWETYLENLSFTYTGSLYLLDSELARDGVLTILDVPALMQSVQTRAKNLLAQKGDDAYDDQGNLRSDVSDQILLEAVEQTLAQDIPCVSRNVTIRVIHRQDQWWILPDQTFLKSLSGLDA